MKILNEIGTITDNNILRILFILVQNSLFGEHGIDVYELSEVTNLGQSKIRSSLYSLEDSGFIIRRKEAKKNIYEADLDFLNEIKIN